MNKLIFRVKRLPGDVLMSDFMNFAVKKKAIVDCLGSMCHVWHDLMPD